MRKLAWAALSFSAAIFLSRYLLPEPWILPAAAACLFISAVLAFLLKKEQRLRILLVGICGALGLGVFYTAYISRDLPCRELDGEKLCILAEVVDFPAESQYSQSLTLRLETEGLPRVKCLLVSYEHDLGALMPGDKISAEVSLKSAQLRSGEEWSGYAADGVFLRAYARSTPEKTGTASLSALKYLPKHFASKVSEVAQEMFSLGTAPFMTALLTGDKSLLQEDVQQYTDMSEAGILHVVAVSGMHVAFLVGFLGLVVRRKKWVSLIGIPLVWLFVPVAGATPSVVRAAFMQSTVLLAPLFKRENDGITSLAAVLALLLLINPYACGSVGLQLSFASMLGIMLLTPKIYRLISRSYAKRKRKAKKTWAGRALDKLVYAAMAAFASSVGAIAFSTPISALYFGYVPIYAIIVNVLIFWAISAAFVLGYAACIFGMLLPFLGQIIGAFASIAAKYILEISHAAASLPMAAVYTEGNAFGIWLALVYVMFAATYLITRKRGFRPLIPTAASICALCAVILVTAAGQKSSSPQITAVDVGQGQSLVITAGEATVVIDCGGNGAKRNAGDIVAGFLTSHSRLRVDALALTHFDSDHVNGVLRLMSRINVKRVIMPPAEEDKTEAQAEIIEYAEKNGTEVYIIKNDTQVLVGDIRLAVYEPVSKKEPCAIYLASVGDYDVFVSGDAYEELEKRFLLMYELPDTELYIAGHHGSKNSSSIQLLKALRAEQAIVSCGYNTYGHPAPETLERLRDAEIEVYITMTGGDITLPMEN